MGESCRINIRGAWSQLQGSWDAHQVARAALTVEKPGAQYSHAYKSGRWDGRVCLMERSGRFLSGLTQRVQAALEAEGYQVSLIKLAPQVATCLTSALRGVTLREYQEQAVQSALTHQRMALECPTGSGKTEIGAEVIRRLGGGVLWLTHRTELGQQTRNRLSQRLGLPVGWVGSGEVEWGGAVTVALVQTLSRRLRDMQTLARLREFRGIILDEVHRGGAETWQAVATACSEAEWRLGLSATVTTGDPLRDLTIEGLTGPRVLGAELGELVEHEWVADATVRLLEPPRVTYPSKQQVRDAVCPTWRRDPSCLARSGAKLYAYAYRVGVLENEQRNALVIQAAAAHYQRGERVLVVVDYKEHADRLDALAGAAGLGQRWRIDGGTPDRSQALHFFSTFTPPCLLIVTPWAREGIDLPAIDVGILAGASLSDIVLVQSAGRMLRVRGDKTQVAIYDFLDGRDPDDRRDYLAMHSAARIATWKERGHTLERGGAWW